IAGDFDNSYYNSINGMNPSGYMYVMGNTNGLWTFNDEDIPLYASTLFKVQITSNTLSAVNVGPATGVNVFNFGNAGGVTETYNSTTGVDYLFTSMDDYA